MNHQPSSILLGVSTASFTNEGAWNEDGKGESIWDRFARIPGKIADGTTPDTACDHYHKYREDVALMRDLGVRAYSFSISWPRIYPTGFGRLNPKGLEFYGRLVDELLAAGITPLATLYHWDLPQALEDVGGWTNPETARRFADYAAVCFERLSDRVKLWFTVNEPGVHAVMGHYDGVHAPARQSRGEMLSAGHTMLLAHGLAVKRFREMAPDDCGIGLIVNQAPVHPATDSDSDHRAAGRFDAFMNRWFLDPIFFGDYPDEMKERFAPELPVLSHDEQEIARQPIDFLGINYYSRVIVGDDPEDPLLGVKGVAPEDGRCTAIGWEIYPRGLCEVLMMVRSRYGDVPLYITENGAAFEDLADEAGVVNDVERIEFLESHLAQAHRAIEEEVDLRGYFVYTLMDNWECAYGFTAKFGLIRMDPVTLKRTIKASGHWYGRLSRSSSRAPSRFL